MAKSKLNTKEKIASLLMVSPLFIGFVVFTVVPLVVAVIYSLVDYMPLSGKIFPVSLDVYKRLFSGELVAVSFGQVIANTLILMISIPVNLTIGLLFSIIITQKGFKGGSFFRVVLYLPAVTGAVAITLVWKLMFNQTQGIVNVVLKAMGLIEENIDWLGITSGAFYPRFVLIIKNVWGGIGGVIILYVAGILNVPKTYYEAAEIDGATKIKQALAITIPMLTPITFYHLIVSVIGGLQAFMDSQLLSTTYATQTIVYFIYDHGINNYLYGYASAASVLLATVIMIITIIQFKISDKWVYSE